MRGHLADSWSMAIELYSAASSPSRLDPAATAQFGDFVQPKFSLTEGSIPRALLSFSLPILFGNVLQSINGSVNAIWVGKFLGEAAFAGVGNSNVVMFLLFGVLFGFSMASTVMVAQCVGREKHRRGEARRRHQRGVLSWAVRSHEPGRISRWRIR